MKNIFIILFFSFIYADCYEIDNQVTCESSEHCVWDGEDGLCEDEHDHGHEEEHCDEITDQVECESSEHCVWDGEDGLCEDEHDLSLIHI